MKERKLAMIIDVIEKICFCIYRSEDHSLVTTVFLELRGPESKVVSDELHDGSGILVLVLLDLIDVSNGIIEGLLGKLAGFGGIILDFVVEDRVVQGKTKSDGVSSLKVLFGFLSCAFVGIMSVISSFIVISTAGVFRDVSVVISLHFVVEDQSFGVGSLGDKLAVDEVENFVAVAVEFSLDLVLVASEETDILGSLLFLLLFDGGKGSPGSSAGADGVLVGNRQQVPLFNGQVSVGSYDLVHGFKHVLKPFGLFGDLGHVEVFVSGAGSHLI